MNTQSEVLGRVSPDARNAAIDQAQQQRMARDTLILQKVNRAHREAFVQRFPGQVEHAMRLTAERLQACLSKNESTDLSNPDTWNATPAQLCDLSHALYYLSILHRRYPMQEE